MRDGILYGAGAVGVGLFVMGQQSVQDAPEAATLTYSADDAAELFDAAMAGDIQTNAVMGLVERVGGSDAGVPEAAMFIAACGVVVKVLEKLTPHFNATGAWVDRMLNGGGKPVPEADAEAGD